MRCSYSKLKSLRRSIHNLGNYVERVYYVNQLFKLSNRIQNQLRFFFRKSFTVAQSSFAVSYHRGVWTYNFNDRLNSATSMMSPIGVYLESDSRFLFCLKHLYFIVNMSGLEIKDDVFIPINSIHQSKWVEINEMLS